MEDRPRDAEGRFLKASRLARKAISVRLSLDCDARFVQIAAQLNKSPTILAREILEKFAMDYKDESAG